VTAEELATGKAIGPAADEVRRCVLKRLMVPSIVLHGVSATMPAESEPRFKIGDECGRSIAIRSAILASLAMYVAGSV